MSSARVIDSQLNKPFSVSKLSGIWLILARSFWILAVVFSIGLYVWLLPQYFEEIVSLQRLSFGFTEGWNPQTFLAALSELGISLHAWSIFSIVGFTIFAVISLLVGSLIFWNKSDEPVAFFTSLFLVMFGTFFNRVMEVLDSLLSGYWAIFYRIIFLIPVICFFILFYLFPSGRFVPRWTRWMVPLWIAVNIGASFFPDTLADINSWSLFLSLLAYLGMISTTIYAQYYRYRFVSTQEERHQTKWAVTGLLVAVIAFFTVGMAQSVIPAFQKNDAIGLSYELFANLVTLIAMGALPLSFGYATLRQRLWNVEPVVSRTLVYLGLSTVVIIIYAFVASISVSLLNTRNSLGVSLVTTTIVALLFQPLRQSLQGLVNRLLFGERDDPYRVLARLGHRLEAALVPGMILKVIVETVAEALKLPQVSIWLVYDGMLHPGAIYAGEPGMHSIQDTQALQVLNSQVDGTNQEAFDPETPFGRMLDQQGFTLVLPVIFRSVLVGVLCLAPRSQGELFSKTDHRLLRDLARGAGAAAHVAQLTTVLQEKVDELQESREQLFTAQEEERKRIQRDLHDGLGPMLASMRLRLEACLDYAQDSAPGLVEELERLDDIMGDAAATIRSLVYDLRPTILDHHGLVGALQQLIESFRVETGIQIDWNAEENFIFSAAAETAIFRVVNEGLLNVRKHANATRVEINLTRTDSEVILFIKDNGDGFEFTKIERKASTGIRSMRERSELLGGRFNLNSQVGVGTVIEMHIPIKRLANYGLKRIDK